MTYIKNIIIIGTGWYGCHIANILQYKYNVTILEKNNKIFDNSSYYNQNRLHLGYHYCRNYNTRSLCKNNYDRFISQYNEVVDNITNNYYILSKGSILDYQTYVNIYTFEQFKFSTMLNNQFKNIDNNIILTAEKVINSDKAVSCFENNLQKVDIKYNAKVKKYYKDTYNLDKILVEAVNALDGTMSIYNCDLLLDCTYNQLGWSKNRYTYELTISLLYKKITTTEFDAITVMDGKFFSIYPRDIKLNIYTLTDVEFTPIISSQNYSDIEEYSPTPEQILDIKNNMEHKVKTYYDTFCDDFEYISYFLSKKTKQISASDSRDITIEEIEKNVVTVNCGKIYGIFDFEDYILKYLECPHKE